jgi:hypothetical protein
MIYDPIEIHILREVIMIFDESFDKWILKLILIVLGSFVFGFVLGAWIF